MKEFIALTALAVMALALSQEAQSDDSTRAANVCAKLRARFGAVVPPAIDKVCPDNNYSTTTIFECEVLNSRASAFVSLGLDASGTLTNNTSNLVKTVCMSEVACATIVPKKFALVSDDQTKGCSDPAVPDVYHESDSQMQTLINAVP
jgi:hypothetical protein